MRKIIICILFLFLYIHCRAPENRSLFIEYREPIQPYEMIWRAVCTVESQNNPLAYNPVEQATGIAQITPIRLRDYNERTGNDYFMTDLYDATISKTVFMYYSSVIGYKNPDQIILAWNCNSYEYLKKVKSCL